MKNRKNFSLIIYVVVLVLLFSWLLGLFGSGHDGLTYSQVVAMFRQEQVRSFTVEGSYMIFPFTHGESGFALEVLPAEKFPVAAIAIAAGAVVLLLIAGKIIKARKAKKKGMLV